MASFVFKLGSIDLSNYVRVATDEGLDPANSMFLSPEFQQSGVSEGNALTSVSANNREMSWPLHLNASSRSALMTLLSDINRQLDLEDTVIEWRNEGATESTFYDVVFGRFDHEYHHRRLSHNWMSGTLRVWVKPYGQTGTYAVRATAAASGVPYVQVHVPTVLGDADALMRCEASIGSPGGFTASGPRWLALSALPHASYPFVASINSGGTLVGASGAVASMYRGLANSPTGSNNTVETVTGHFNAQLLGDGPHRILMLARNKIHPGVAFTAKYDSPVWGTGILGPTIVATLGDWQLIDLGRIELSPALSKRSGALGNVGVTVYGIGLASGAIASQPAPSVVSSPGVHVTAMYAVPERTTVIYRDDSNSSNTNDNYIFDEYEAKGAIRTTSPASDLTRKRRGRPPLIQPGSQTIAMIAHQDSKAANGHQAVTVKVRDRFTFER